MHNPILFTRGGILLDGDHLLGAHRWSGAVTLGTAHLVARPPVEGTLRVLLEVGGVATGQAFTVGASDELEVRQSLVLNRVVPAGQTVRWAIEFDGEGEEAATAASVTVMIP
jgi:hypothetical protein